MGRIYQRRSGGTYYGYWTDVRGRHHRKSLKTRDAAVARSRLRQLELVSTEPTARARHTLSAAITHLLEVVERGNAGATWGAYRQKGENLVDVLGDVDISELGRDAFLEYVRRRKSENASDSTVHKELVVARRAFAEARDRGLWSGDPRAVVPTVRVRYRPRRVWLTAKQADALLAELAGDRRLWAALACWGGLCLGEIERLEWEHVDLKHERIRVPGTKREARLRTVPMAPLLVRLLTAAKKTAAAAKVVRRWGSVRRDLGAAIDRANRRARELAAKLKRKAPADMPRVTPNDLRRTYASWMKQRGMDSFTVARLLGHSSSKMVELVYGQLDDATFARAVASLPRSATQPAVEKRVSKTRYHSGTPMRRRSRARRRNRRREMVPRVGIEPTTRGFSVRVFPCILDGERHG